MQTGAGPRDAKKPNEKKIYETMNKLFFNGSHTKCRYTQRYALHTVHQKKKCIRACKNGCPLFFVFVHINTHAHTHTHIIDTNYTGGSAVCVCSAVGSDDRFNGNLFVGAGACFYGVFLFYLAVVYIRQ